MVSESFDVAVLGGGTGGYTAAIRAAQLGKRTAVIESNKLGGTCLHRGCIPTKVLLQSAEHLDLARRLAEFGVRAGEPSLDYGTVQRRKDEVVGRLFSGLQRLVKASGVKLIAGTGRLDGAKAVRIGDLSKETPEVKVIPATQ